MAVWLVAYFVQVEFKIISGVVELSFALFGPAWQKAHEKAGAQT